MVKYLVKQSIEAAKRMSSETPEKGVRQIYIIIRFYAE